MKTQKNARKGITISEKVNFKPTLVTIKKEIHCILVKGKIQREDMMSINIYTLNRSTLSFINISEHAKSENSTQ